MLRVGITGQPGFIGSHLYNCLGLQKDITRIECRDEFFKDPELLKKFVLQCDVIVHLAGMNRHPDPQVIYDTNVKLAQQLIAAMTAAKVTPHVIFSSSTQESRDNLYGKSKKKARQLLTEWARKKGASFSGLVIPNVFGPFGKPFYNSFVATFCYQLTHAEQPKIDTDSEVKLIYVGSLCEFILQRMHDVNAGVKPVQAREIAVPHDFSSKVSQVLGVLENFRSSYFLKGIIPKLNDINEINLFNTFRACMDHNEIFPIKLEPHADDRGSFTEIIRLGTGGQVSFSTTVPGITRGNHFHVRKIERFAVIRGRARIQLRRLGTNEVLNYELDGKSPAYVDMPVWFTHNITNIGDEDLYTIFWINEFFDPRDPDTFFEPVGS